ncbi:hypothetical protein RGR602_PB00252 (plasmid) [Rhizobium gallicum bv. gallicum R602sp]|uniref:Uncharacterized protein n=1 Tax=Rhizobium gallicum bv. gallicum R602sp TaxID=1041138 RepID=A0A0B4X6V1_9HYPH|nr:hypothetical protein RGR602_PB00252 [Rhizobium gallicum bv. gallicum R602sp]
MLDASPLPPMSVASVMKISNERTQGAKRLQLSAFPWFRCVLGVFADRLNLLCSQDRLFRPSAFEPISNP